MAAARVPRRRDGPLPVYNDDYRRLVEPVWQAEYLAAAIPGGDRLQTMPR